MMLKFFSVSLYALRWLGWLLTYSVVWPAATLMLLAVMLFRMEHMTPGEALAQEIASVTHNVRPGEFRISACRDTASSVDKPDVVCRDLESRVTGAEGYAAHINGSLKVVTEFWVLMAFVFSGLALVTGCRPYFCDYGQSRSALCRYGMPVSRALSGAVEDKKNDSKREREHD
jgi:hypothetical protein